MLEDAQGYRAYLVRLWQARKGDRVVWRASAEDAHTHERHAFAGLAQLFVFLQAATGQSSTPAAEEERHDYW